MSDMVQMVFNILKKYAEETGRPFSEVAQEYAILLRPVETDAEGKIRCFDSLARLMGDRATANIGPPVFEGKENQTKLLILRYISKRDCATSLDVSSDIHFARTNACERLRRYCQQRLLIRQPIVTRRRGRRTMVYKLTEAGQRRLAWLEKNVKFRRAETEASKEYRFYQKMAEMYATALRQWRTP